MRGDAGHRKGRATRSESSEKTQSLSPLGRVGGRQQALEMTHIAPGSTCALLPTRRDPGAIPMGHYHQDLVLTRVSRHFGHVFRMSSSDPALAAVRTGPWNPAPSNPG
jgi:hypothetical protein